MRAGVGREEAKASQVKTRGPELPIQMVLTIQPGRRDIIPVKGRIPAQLVCSTGVNVLVMVLQGRKSSPQKSRPLESGHSRRAVWIAIEYSYV